VRIFTVGHSTHALDAFVALLQGAGVEGIADVRAYPGSRRMPHFGREELERTLPGIGIRYRHLPALGGRRRPAPDSPNGGWNNGQFRGYADHMASDEFLAGRAALEALAAERPTAAMCAEGPWWHCHRRLLADALLARGHEVAHLHPDGRVEAHRLTEFALVDGDSLTYPPPQGSLGL
jgi:uncharacterized protein (DUF488 family)